MPFTLSKDCSVKYSAGEKSIFALLPQRGPPLNTGEIVEKRYGGNAVPFNARKSTVCMLDNLRRKIEENGEPFRLSKGKRAGPHDIEWAIERR